MFSRWYLIWSCFRGLLEGRDDALLIITLQVQLALDISQLLHEDELPRGTSGPQFLGAQA